jgi:hypothetical protein
MTLIVTEFQYFLRLKNLENSAEFRYLLITKIRPKIQTMTEIRAELRYFLKLPMLPNLENGAHFAILSKTEKATIVTTIKTPSWYFVKQKKAFTLEKHTKGSRNDINLG